MTKLTEEERRERIYELHGWACSRIRHCRDIEERFSTRSQALIEAVTERRALLAVLSILGLADVSRACEGSEGKP